MSVSSILKWYPSPCQDPSCQQSHKALNDGNQFHPGTYIQIRGWNCFEVCNTKLKDAGEVVPNPKGEKCFRSFQGALNIRTLILSGDLKPRFFDYATGNFPCVVEALNARDPNLIEHAKEVELPRILEDASNLESISQGI